MRVLTTTLLVGAMVALCVTLPACTTTEPAPLCVYDDGSGFFIIDDCDRSGEDAA